MGGKMSRDKGAQGERDCCHFFEALGFRAKRVGNTEANIGARPGCDVEVSIGKEEPWSVQAKAVRIWPNVVKAFADGATLLYVHLTGRGRFLVIHADDVEGFARQVVEAGKARRAALLAEAGRVLEGEG